MSTKVPRVSVESIKTKNINKIVRSCILSKSVYGNAINKNLIVERQGRCLYVCFKGCSTLSDFMTSVDMRNCRLHGESLGVHNGFCERSKSLQSEVNYEIIKNCMNYEISDIIFTGHSAGGSTAQIFGLFSFDDIERDINIHCYTFGSPKTGDECFKDAIEYCLGENLLRVETYNDIVCLLPMQNKFQHAGEVLLLKNGAIYKSQKDDEFFSYYHTDYVEFVKDLKSKGLLNKKEIDGMISDHYCDRYTSNIISLINLRSCDKLNTKTNDCFELNYSMLENI